MWSGECNTLVVQALSYVHPIRGRVTPIGSLKMWASVSPKNNQSSVTKRNEGNGYKHKNSTTRNILSILIICRVFICKFVYLLKFICYPQINTHAAFSVVSDMHKMGEKFESPSEHILSLSRTKSHSALSFQLSYINKCAFRGLFSAIFFCAFC